MTSAMGEGGGPQTEMKQPWLREFSSKCRNWGGGAKNHPGLGFNGVQKIYFLISRHVQTTKHCHYLETNLQQPRRIYVHKSHLRAIESLSRTLATIICVCSLGLLGAPEELNRKVLGVKADMKKKKEKMS